MHDCSNMGNHDSTIYFTMQTLAFFVVIVLSGSFCTGSPCFLGDGVCNDRLVPRRFPQTTEEFERGCNGLKTYGGCILDVKERCGDQENAIPLLRRALTFLNRTCDPNEESYQILSTNITCVHHALTSVMSACNVTPYSTRINVLNTFMQSLLDKGLSSSSINQCRTTLWSQACQGMDIEDRCGTVVRDLMLEMWRKGTIFSSDCEDDVVLHVPELIQDFRDESSRILSEE